MPNVRHLQQTLFDLQKRFGKTALQPLRERETPPALSTGFATLDAVLSAGGLRRGALTELVGMPTAGLTTLALHVVAGAQAEDASAVYLDLPGTLDPDYAARCGVALDRLLIVHPREAFQAFEIARDLIKTHPPATLILDLLTVPRHAPLDMALRRLHDAVIRSGSVVVLLTAAPLDGETCMTTRLGMRRLGWLLERADVVGYQTAVTVLKDTGLAEVPTVTLALRLDGAVDGGEP